jgi:thioredoxin 2
VMESLHIACPDCLTVNRVPAERLQQVPKCGHCRQALFRDKPVALTQSSFRRFIRGTDLPVLVDFWAPWCGPCQVMAPAFENAARDLGTEALFAKVDTQSEPGLGNELGIRSIPTLVLFQHSQEIARHSGAIGAIQIIHWVRTALSN